MSGSEAVRDRRRGMLLGLAVGDALGAAVEFSLPGHFQPVTDYRGGGPHGLGPGEWTDDTSMALALADSIAGVGWDLNDQARRYVDWWQNGAYSVTGACFDIGNQTRRSLAAFRQVGEVARVRDSDHRSAGNGSIMRLAPVPIAFGSLYPAEIALLAERGEESSITTHPAPVCRSACRYLTVVLAGLAAGEPRETVLSADWPVLTQLGAVDHDLAPVVQGSFRTRTPPEIRGSGYVVASLEAALWAFSGAASFSEAVLRAVNLGDDADTTGAVCGQLAGAYWGESGIPAHWRTGLQKRDWIEKALAGLGVELGCSGDGKLQ
ncbi:MAG: ADP-ribosylglycohydrolase family protein [Armatimonadetes bacterium]|nr:ADP-ribosylglycohydrolase family protein [Armatimonadota bacterium]